MLNDKLKDILITMAKQSVACDEEEFNAYDYSGGNYDDAHQQGMNDGETLLARFILESLGIPYE